MSNKSQYVYIAPDYREGTELGFLPAIPGVISTAAGAAGASGGLPEIGKQAGGLIQKAGSILGIGGGGGPSKSEDKAEAAEVLQATGSELAAVIAMTDKGDINNSQLAAQKVKDAVATGNPSLLDLQNIIDTTLGYDRNTTPEPDSNWPWGNINPLLREMLAQKSKGSGGMMAIAPGGPNQAGFGKLALIGGGFLVLTVGATMLLNNDG